MFNSTATHEIDRLQGGRGEEGTYFTWPYPLKVHAHHLTKKTQDIQSWILGTVRGQTKVFFICLV